MATLRRPGVQVALGVLVQVLAISCWFATGAALPSLTTALRLDGEQRTFLMVAVQLGFAVGAAVVGLNRLPDRLPPRLLLTAGALATAGATVLPLLGPPNLILLYLSRFLVGLFLATVYPTGMRAILSWVGSKHRGVAVAAVVAALTVGTAVPQLLVATPIQSWESVLLTTAILAILAAVLSLGVMTGPATTPVRPTSWHELTMLIREPIQRRISISYIAHMWEVYGFWVWLPTFLSTVMALHFGPLDTAAQIGLLSFGIIGVAGAAGCFLGGWLAIWFGKRVVARISVAVSGVCVLCTPLLPLIGPVPGAILLGIWGASVISDSPLYSAMTGDAAAGRAVGTALALQMSVGYFVSVVAIIVVPLSAAVFGWQYAFLVLAVGPLVSVLFLRPWQPQR